jgi:hypothetical protein
LNKKNDLISQIYYSCNSSFFFLEKLTFGKFFGILWLLPLAFSLGPCVGKSWESVSGKEGLSKRKKERERKCPKIFPENRFFKKKNLNHNCNM